MHEFLRTSDRAMSALLIRTACMLAVLCTQVHSLPVPICLPPFLRCPSGTCALDKSLCSACHVPGIVCPATNSCVPAYIQCKLPVYLDGAVPVVHRLKSLVDAMSLEEKVAQLSVQFHGSGWSHGYYSPAILRLVGVFLSIYSFWFCISFFRLLLPSFALSFVTSFPSSWGSPLPSYTSFAICL